MTTNKRFRQLLNENVGRQLAKSVDDIDDDSNLFDLGLDSIGFINIIIQIENNFGVVIAQEEMDLERLNSVRAFAQCIDGKSAQATT